MKEENYEMEDPRTGLIHYGFTPHKGGLYSAWVTGFDGLDLRLFGNHVMTIVDLAAMRHSQYRHIYGIPLMLAKHSRL